jgi:hypothetical protein
MLVESEGNKKFQTKVEWGIDFASEHERYRWILSCCYYFSSSIISYCEFVVILNFCILKVFDWGDIWEASYCL